MDNLFVRLVLGSLSMLPSSADRLHVLLSTSFGSTGVLATAGIRARSDDFLSCKLRSSEVSEVEARSVLARALFISIDWITWISAGALSVDNCFAASPKVPLVEGGIREFDVAYSRAFRCFQSVDLDMASQLGVHQYCTNCGKAPGDQAHLMAALSKFTPNPQWSRRRCPGGHWATAGVGVHTDVTAYPFLLRQYVATILLIMAAYTSKIMLCVHGGYIQMLLHLNN